MDYQEFLKNKIEIAQETGFDIDISEINPVLKPHQRDAVKWNVKGGRRANFMSFGLGKTLINLETCRIIIGKMGGKALIVLPLGVKQEFKRDAVKLLGMAEPEYCRTMAEVHASTTNIILTNYERVRDGDIDPTYFTVTALDEAAVLRSYGSKTYQTFLQKFKGVQFKFVFTATPSPNKYKELIHYGGYLEVMDTGQALTRFFQRDSKKANNLTLYPHKEKDFWIWLSSWALFVSKPSDLGYADTGYDLPPLDVRFHEISVDHKTAGFDRYGQGKLIRDATISLADAAKEKRDSIDTRVKKAAEIVNANPDEHFILWHDLEAERHEIKKVVPEAVEIFGNQDYELREQRTLDFSDGKYRILATKKELSGSGCNFQYHCHRAVFVGIDYEFNDFIQAIHRIYRFLQDKQVIIDIIYTESEKQILEALMKKWQAHNYLAEQMTDLIKQHGLNSVSMLNKLARSIGVERVKIQSKNYTTVLNDCVLEYTDIPSDSFDMILTSIPFGNHYEYTPSYNDFGHNKDTDIFMEQMDFLSPNLLRTLKPGRVFACHTKDRVLFGNTTGTGMPTIEPFHAACINHYIKHGFQYFGMITVITDVVRENAQTYRLGYTQNSIDGTKMGVGCPEYILLFRKLPSNTSTAYADVPVSKAKEEYTRGQWQLDAHGFWRSSGDRALSKEELYSIPTGKIQKVYTKFSLQNVYDYAEHVRLCEQLDKDDRLPASFMIVAPASWNDEVWHDINRMRTLNSSQKAKNLQMHVCPLQFDIVDRLINRFTNEGEMVADPFGGIATVGQRAIKKGRKVHLTELNPDSFRDGLGYLQAAEADVDIPTLFDFLENKNEADSEVLEGQLVIEG